MNLCPNSYGNVQLLVSVLRRARGSMTFADLRAAVGGDPTWIRGLVSDCVEAGVASVVGDTVILTKVA